MLQIYLKNEIKSLKGKKLDIRFFMVHSLYSENLCLSSMTKTILSVLLITTILATSTLATSTFMIEEADAYQSQGTPKWKYGSATAKIVCGDRLCSEYPGGYEAWKESQNNSSSGSNSYDASSSEAILQFGVLHVQVTNVERM